MPGRAGEGRVDDGGALSRRARSSERVPEIGRDADTRHFERARVVGSNRSVAFLSLIIVMALLASAGLFAVIGEHRAPDGPLASESYTSHAVISIEGDSDFASQASSEGWPGNGHQNSPYIISGYQIDGLGYLCPIKIGNTTVSFEVRDCYLYNGEVGAFLYGVSNGILRNNTCIDNLQSGIGLQNSDDNVIFNSTCYGNHLNGISILYSNRNTVNNNTCYANGWRSYEVYGIQCSGNDNVIGHNLCFGHNGSGIFAQGQRSVAFANNCTANGYGIVAAAYSTVRNNTCTGNGAGILVGSTAPVSYHSDVYAQVLSNNCSGNDWGIELYGWHSTLRHNLCDGCNYSGIHSYEGTSYNDMNNNSCVGNLVAGIWLEGLNDDPCTFNVIERNNCSLNGQHGILMEGSDHNTILNNTCDDNGQAGIFLDSCQYEVLQGNTMFHDGILLEGSILQNWVLNTIGQSNLVNGLPVYFLKDGDGTAIPYGMGQYIIANSKNIVMSQMDMSNGTVGFSFGFCSESTVMNCSSSNNTIYGLFVSDCTSLSVVNCTFSGNTMHSSTYTMSGILMSVSSGCTVANCTVSWNDNGITLFDSESNLFDNNTIANNSAVGMDLGLFSSYNVIRGNMFENNSAYAIIVPGVLHFSYTVGNMIFLNDFRFNNGATTVYDASHIQAYDFHGDNFWNASGYGNNWSDWQSPDADHDGIVDDPYLIGGYTPTYDYYPLTRGATEPIPEFGLVLPLLGTMALLVGLGLWRRSGQGS